MALTDDMAHCWFWRGDWVDPGGEPAARYVNLASHVLGRDDLPGDIREELEPAARRVAAFGEGLPIARSRVDPATLPG